MKQYRKLLIALPIIILLFMSSYCRKGPPTGVQKQEIEWINNMFIFEGDGITIDSIKLNKNDTLYIEVALVNGNIIRNMFLMDEENYRKMKKWSEDYSAIFSKFLFTSGVFYVPIHLNGKYFFMVNVDEGIGPTKLHEKVMIIRWE
jgi:hypothetical protein